MLQPCSSQPHQSRHLHGFPFPACPPLPPAALWLLQRLHCPPGLEEQPQPPDKRHSAASPSLMLLLLPQGRWHPQVASAQRGGTGVLHSFSKAPPAVCPWQPQIIQASPRMLPGRDAGSTQQASRKPGTMALGAQGESGMGQSQMKTVSGPYKSTQQQVMVEAGGTRTPL